MSPSRAYRVYIAFGIVVLGAALGNLSQNATNAMLNAIQLEFGIDIAIGQLLTTLYMLVAGITMPVTAFLLKRFTQRGLLCTAWAFLLVGGCVAFVAPNFYILLGARILQGISIGIIMPFVTVIAMTSFPGKEPIAMGIAGIAIGFAPSVGPSVGGAFVDTIGWRYFFILLLCFAAALFVMTLIFVQREPAHAANERLDAASVVLSTLGFGGVLLGFSYASMYGFASAFAIVPLCIGVIGIVLFIRRQNATSFPLISMRLFDDERYSVSFVANILLFASFMGAVMAIQLFWQKLCGGTALEAGIIFLPAAVAAAIANPISGVLSNRIGYRPVMNTAAALMTIGAGSFLFVDETTPMEVLMVLQFIRGAGVSSLIPPLSSWGLEKTTRQLLGDGSSFMTLIRQISGSIGTALMVLLITVGTNAGAALLGYRMAFGLSFVLALALLVILVVQFRKEAQDAE